MANQNNSNDSAGTRRFLLIGCAVATLVILIIVGAVVAVPFALFNVEPGSVSQATVVDVAGAEQTQQAVPALTAPSGSPGQGIAPQSLVDLYEQVNPGVVNIRVFVQQEGRAGTGAGSGFVLDEQGHIVTNNHVVAQADRITVLFFDGVEVLAEVVGTDADSDLAVIRVEELPENAHSLTLGDSDAVQAGQWVVAIGNPFALGGSMSTGIVSAVGRMIPSGQTPFSIPRAIQTDAAINPGNSGGPLLDLGGNVIGVNAQIATGGQAQGNVGVGFAIPSNVVRRVVPVLIEMGTYEWPWLGIEGTTVNLLIAEANDLDTQMGAYVDNVIAGGPADAVGLQGTRGSTTVDGIQVPVGGDVIIEANGETVIDFSDLLATVAFSEVDEELQLTVIRDGREQQLTVELAPRPEDFQP